MNKEMKARMELRELLQKICNNYSPIIGDVDVIMELERQKCICMSFVAHASIPKIEELYKKGEKHGN